MRLGVDAGIIAIRPLPRTRPVNVSLPVIPFVDAPGDAARTHAWVGSLQAPLPEARIVPFDALTADDKAACTVAIVADPSPADLMQLPRLRWLQSVWAGVERLVTDCARRSITLVRLVDPTLAATMAEAVLAWCLYLHRDMPTYAAQQRLRQWRQHPYIPPARKIVGLLGIGELGRAAAERLAIAGFQVCGWSRASKSLPGLQTFTGEPGLLALLGRTDILVCLLPLTHETRGLLDAERMSRLPQGAAIINFARGAIVNEGDLRKALDRGHLSHAVLDVFDVEPLPEDRWPWTHPRVTVLPHCSAPTNMESASQIVAGSIRAYLKTGAIPKGVDIARGY
jgi:glyoxylate/hydroxypyruvate reductase A